ncbi:hypothetical protein CRM22_006930 [Opisthorchis felineus]|uniref:Uncharacterized protein n=1 Tax=Opisthorchis felineus TaxID=147828 RepID=A0A4S2LIL0_OPIFE|nr:hypothetical protein CRM22_006930 [Opisthorchis felineus]TGZ63426.1 hypothetical protein CRM22_006930 [Opisthorchis felineus]
MNHSIARLALKIRRLIMNLSNFGVLVLMGVNIVRGTEEEYKNCKKNCESMIDDWISEEYRPVMYSCLSECTSQDYSRSQKKPQASQPIQVSLKSIHTSSIY